MCWVWLQVPGITIKVLLQVSGTMCWVWLQVSVYWYLGRALCDMWVSMDLLCCTASILHLVAIAVDRFWAVSNIDYIRRRCARQILLMIAIVWLVSVAISIPPLFGWRHESDNPELSGVCMISQDHGYTIFSTVGAFYCPLVLMLVLNFKIYRAARYRIRRKGFMARHANRPAHVPVPALHVQEDTTARDARNSSGSDVSQDGISVFRPSCIVNNEISRVDTGFDSNTGDYEQQYSSYYPGDSTTDSNPNDSYYPLSTEDPDPPPLSPPPAPPPSSSRSFTLGLPVLEMASEAGDRSCGESGPCNPLLSTGYRTLSLNHLTVPSAQFLALPTAMAGSDRLSISDACPPRKCSSVTTDSLSLEECISLHLAVPESSEIEVPDAEQVAASDCDCGCHCHCHHDCDCGHDCHCHRDDCDCGVDCDCEDPAAAAAAAATTTGTAADSRLVQFDNRVRVEGDTDVSETSNSLKPGEEEGTSGEAQSYGEGDSDWQQDGAGDGGEEEEDGEGGDQRRERRGGEDSGGRRDSNTLRDIRRRSSARGAVDAGDRWDSGEARRDSGEERRDRRDSAAGDGGGGGGGGGGVDDEERRDRRNSGDDTTTTSCCSNNLLSVELSCMSNGIRRHHHHFHHKPQHQQEEQQERKGQHPALTVEPPVIIRKDSCSQFMSESRCLATPSFHSVSSPSTTTTTTSGTCSGHGGNQLAVPGPGTVPVPQPVKSRANNNTKRARNREKEKQRREKLEMRRERKAARVLGIITGAFVLCWLPFFILALVGPFLPAHRFVPPVVASLFLWLGYFNSLINPVIYTVFNPSFRNAFRKIFFKRMRSVGR